jgi:Fic family protein
MSELEKYEKEELLKQLKVIWTYHSNAIEGNTLSKGDTSFIIENGLTIQGKSISEHNQVLGHSRAIDLIYAMLDKESMTEKDLFLLHKAIQTEIVIDSEKPNGAYKVVPNGRWIEIEGKDEHRYYPHPNDMQHLMKLWFDAYENINRPINSKKEAVKIYADMHIAFAAIHPFWDGNGRLARLVANLPLLKNNYLPIIVSNDNRQVYIKLLSSYNMSAKELDSHSVELLDRNNEYKQLLAFFETEYSHTELLLSKLKSSKNKLNGKIS